MMKNELLKLLLLIFMIFTGCNNKNDKPVIVSAESLIEEFQNNNGLALQKYKGKILQITGEMAVKEFPKDTKPLKDASRIIFGKVNQHGSPFFPGNTIIVCSFDEIVVHELTEGEKITVQGNFVQYGNTYGNVIEIFLNKGKIINPANRS